MSVSGAGLSLRGDELPWTLYGRAERAGEESKAVHLLSKTVQSHLQTCQHLFKTVQHLFRAFNTSSRQSLLKDGSKCLSSRFSKYLSRRFFQYVVSSIAVSRVPIAINPRKIAVSSCYYLQVSLPNAINPLAGLVALTGLHGFAFLLEL